MNNGSAKVRYSELTSDGQFALLLALCKREMVRMSQGLPHNPQWVMGAFAKLEKFGMPTLSRPTQLSGPEVLENESLWRENFKKGREELADKGLVSLKRNAEGDYNIVAVHDHLIDWAAGINLDV